MLKQTIIALILLTAVFISAKAYCQQNDPAQQIKTLSGKIVSLDVEGNVVVLKTDQGDVEFYITVQSIIYRGSVYIASIDLDVGDPVTIQYQVSAGKNDIIKLTAHKGDDITAGYTFNQEGIKINVV